MLRSYILVAWRSLLRNKLFSIINIAGLAIGMTVVFHIYRYVTVEHSYDTFHTDVERIYRVPLGYIENGTLVRNAAANHPATGPMLKADFQEVENYTRFSRSEVVSPELTISYTNDRGESIAFNERNVIYGDNQFFSIFSFPIAEGDAKTALEKPSSIVLSRQMAKKYFNEGPALNKTIRLNRVDYTVTGVMENVPENSHLKFDAVASSAGIWDNLAGIWTWPVFYTYVKLIPGADNRALENKFPAFVEKYVGKQVAEKDKFGIDLQPVVDIHLKSNLAGEQSTNSSERTVNFMSLLGIIILAIAWINYINLSTAKSIERAKEVGLRKISGASRKQLITQFVFDACLINIMALFLATALTTATIPVFEQLTGKAITNILLSSGKLYSMSFWGWVTVAVAIGILIVGMYPALLLSSFNPANVLKGKFAKSRSGTVLRQGLVGFQYTFSIFLIAGTVAVSRQINFMQSQDLGFNKNQILVMRAPSVFDSTLSTQLSLFKSNVENMAAIKKFTVGGGVPGHLLPYPNSIRRAEQSVDENTGYYPISIDDAFLPTFEMPLAAGRNFEFNERFHFPNIPEMTLVTFFQPPATGRDGTCKVIINESLCKRLGFRSPDEAIHEHVKFRTWSEFDGEIIGVVKNYHQQSLKDSYSPIAYFYPAFDAWSYFSARIEGGNLPATIETLKKEYTASFPGNAFEYFFLDDYFDHQYREDQQFKDIFTALTVLAIIIACMGLLGLALFSVGQRVKEIGIRKVLGASVPSILVLFSKDSIRLLSISYLITLPVIWLAVRSWLQNFAFHIGLEWIIFFAPPVCLLLISLSTVIVVSLKTALMSPVISLRSE